MQFAKQELEEIMQDCKGQRATANRKLKQPLRLFGKRGVQSKITQLAECEEKIKSSIKISATPLSASNCNKINCIIDVVFNLGFFTF